MEKADAAEELRGDDSEEPPGVDPAVDGRSSIRQFVSIALHHRGWSLTEGADGSAAITIAPNALDLVFAAHEPNATAGSAAAPARVLEDKPVLVAAGRR